MWGVERTGLPLVGSPLASISLEPKGTPECHWVHGRFGDCGPVLQGSQEEAGEPFPFVWGPYKPSFVNSFEQIPQSDGLPRNSKSC